MISASDHNKDHECQQKPALNVHFKLPNDMSISNNENMKTANLSPSLSPPTPPPLNLCLSISLARSRRGARARPLSLSRAPPLIFSPSLQFCLSISLISLSLFFWLMLPCSLVPSLSLFDIAPTNGGVW